MGSYGIDAYGHDDKLDQVVDDIAKGTKIADAEEKEEEEHAKYEIFGEIMGFARAACDMYTEGEMSWDDALSDLSKTILKFKGKEQELLDACKEEEDDENES